VWQRRRSCDNKRHYRLKRSAFCGPAAAARPAKATARRSISQVSRQSQGARSDVVLRVACTAGHATQSIIVTSRRGVARIPSAVIGPVPSFEVECNERNSRVECLGFEHTGTM